MNSMLLLIDEAIKARLPFQYNPECGAFEADEFRVTMCAAPYKVIDLTGAQRDPLYLHKPELVVEYIKMTVEDFPKKLFLKGDHSHGP